MKLRSNFKLRKVVDQYLLVSVGPDAADFRGVITLNPTGAFLCERLEEDTSREQLIAAMCEEYEVTPEQAEKDIDLFLDTVIPCPPAVF